MVVAVGTVLDSLKCKMRCRWVDSMESELGHVGRAKHVFRTLFSPVLGYDQWYELFCPVLLLAGPLVGAKAR
jgi:hypothetical protein